MQFNTVFQLNVLDIFNNTSHFQHFPLLVIIPLCIIHLKKQKDVCLYEDPDMYSIAKYWIIIVVAIITRHVGNIISYLHNRVSNDLMIILINGKTKRSSKLCLRCYFHIKKEKMSGSLLSQVLLHPSDSIRSEKVTRKVKISLKKIVTK